MKHVFIFRHGETDWNVEERFQGHIDIPMNANGRKQAALLTPSLELHRVQAILTSDLLRAKETAEIASKPLNLPLFVDPGLREAHLGRAQGMTRLEIEKEFGEDLALRWRSWHVSDADVYYPGGETGAQVMSRAFAAIEGFLREQPFERVGVSTHGGVIRRIMQRIMVPTGSATTHSIPIPNTVLYPLRYDPTSGAWSINNPD